MHQEIKKAQRITKHHHIITGLVYDNATSAAYLHAEGKNLTDK